MSVSAQDFYKRRSEKIKHHFLKEAIWWVTKFYGEAFFNPDDHFSYQEMTSDKLEEVVQWIIEYDEIKGATRYFWDLDLVLFHAGEGEYKVFKVIDYGAEFRDVECLTIAKMGMEKTYQWIEEQVKSRKNY